MICVKCKREVADGKYCLECGASQNTSVRAQKKRGNGQGSVYKRGQTWTACITKYDAGRRTTQTKGGFARKKDALGWLSAKSIQSGHTTDKTFDEIYQEWSAHHYPTISSKKSQNYEIAYKRCAELYNMKWSDIGIKHMQKIVNEIDNAYYPRRDIKVLLSLMSKYAILAGYADNNYAQYITLPPKSKPHKVPFSSEEITALWEDYKAGNTFTGAILIMIYTGIRYGEISTIKPENIHLEESYMLGGIKTEAGREGEILLVDEIKPIIQDLLLPHNQIKEISETTFRAKFAAALERCGCSPHTPHECRHTCGTILAQKGVQPAIITAIMRHTSYSQTLEYTHIDRETKIDALKAITRSLHTTDG